MMQSGLRIRQNSKLGPNKAPFGITNAVKPKPSTNSDDLSIGKKIGYDPRMCRIGSFYVDESKEVPALFSTGIERLYEDLTLPVKLEYYEIGPKGLLMMPGTYCQAVTEQTLWCGESKPKWFKGKLAKLWLLRWFLKLLGLLRYYTFDISGKSSSARNALFTVMDSGIGDVGYNGPLTLELYAAGPVMLYEGSIVAQVRFFEVEGEQEHLYSGYDTKTFDRAPQPKPIPVRDKFLEL